MLYPESQSMQSVTDRHTDVQIPCVTLRNLRVCCYVVQSTPDPYKKWNDDKETACCKRILIAAKLFLTLLSMILMQINLVTDGFSLLPNSSQARHRGVPKLFNQCNISTPMCTITPLTLYGHAFHNFS